MCVVKVRQPHLRYYICYRRLGVKKKKKKKGLRALDGAEIVSLSSLRVKSAHRGTVPLLLHLPHGQ